MTDQKAQIFPDIQKSKVIFSSRAEETVYYSARELPSGWFVYYSSTLSVNEGSQGQVDNEIDFVFYHSSYGLVVVEVKGGRIGYNAETRQFSSQDRLGRVHKIKNPFQQALVWKSRFVRYLRSKEIKVPVSHAVCFPHVIEADFPEGAEVEPKLLIGKNRLNDLEKALIEIVFDSQPKKFLQFSDVREQIDTVLKGTSFTTRYYFRDYIDGHELKIKDVEFISETLVLPIAGALRMAIEGEAGTGKTMLAILLARYFRDQGKKVIIISSNALMNTYLRKESGTGIHVETYASLSEKFKIQILKPASDFVGNKEDWIQYEGPDRLKRAIEDSPIRYDVVLCDEAQDVQPFWWEAIVTILNSGSDGRLYLFFDRSQGVFGSGSKEGNFVPEDVIPIPAPYFTLVNNYRTTREIGFFARLFRTGKEILPAHCNRIGYVPELLTYNSPEECQSKLSNLLEKLIRHEGLRAEEITILSGRKPFASGSALSGVSHLGEFELFELSANKRVKKKLDSKKVIPEKGGKTLKINENEAIAVATIASFKGLETKVAIIANISEYHMSLNNPIMASLLYVACTRAKHMLYIMAREGEPKCLKITDALKKMTCHGGLVLNNDASDYEYTGVVCHYNPDRFGLLRVDDSVFGQSTVQFFPSDVKKANLGLLKVGEKLRFRPLMEGRFTIACELDREE